MKKHNTFALPAALLFGLGVLSGCDSVEITGPGDLEIGAAQQGTVVGSTLADGDFEQGANNWQICSAAGNSELSNDASSGTMAMQLGSSACRSQNVTAVAGQSYTLSCDAKTTDTGWSAVSLAFLDQNLQPLGSREVGVTSLIYSNVDITLRAPAATNQAEVLFYSEGSMSVDNCNLTQL